MATRKATAVLMAAVLAACFNPGAALASSLEAGASAGMSAQASMQTVYVLVKARSTFKSSIEGVTPGFPSPATVKFAYNSNGLVKKDTARFLGNQSSWKYDKSGNLSAEISNGKTSRGLTSSKITYTRNDSGMLTKSVRETANGSSREKETTTYKIKSGRIVSSKNTSITYDDDGSAVNDSTTATAYAYKDGRMSTKKTNGAKTTYAYDSKGNLVKISPYKAMKNTYDAKGLLVKRSLSGFGVMGDVTETTIYTYKAMKVNSSMAAKVKAQQWGLLNANLNFTWRTTTALFY